MSLRNEPGLAEAATSILRSPEPVELVVVNTGGGGADRALRAAGLDVPLVDVPEACTPGRARNLGLAATSAPIVSFIAADCVAAPDWVQARLRRHEASPVVASAVTNLYAGNPVADASYYLLFFTRMPDGPTAGRVLFGCSYERALFDRFGTFPEDLSYGEDAAFNRRLQEAGIQITWAPEIRTAHRHPRSFVRYLSEHFHRGRRITRMHEALSGVPHRTIVSRRALANVGPAIRAAWRFGGSRRRAALAAPLIVPGALAYALGALRAGAER